MQVAHDEILRRILTLELEPGVTFTEGALAEQLNLSKTPVREALLLIGADGLVFPQVGSGYRVSPVTLKGARDLLRYWTLLTSHSSALAAENGVGSNQLSIFTDVVEGNLPVGGQPSPYSAETMFHLVLGHAARNEELIRDLHGCALKVQRLLALAALTGTAVHDPQDEHGVILGAVQRGDSEGARQFTEAHAGAVEKGVMEALMSSDALLSVNLG